MNLTDWQDILAACLKSTLLMTMGAICLKAMSNASAASRHLVCALTLGGALLLPVLSLMAPFRVSALYQMPVAAAAAAVSTEMAGGVRLSQLLMWIWAVGFSVCLLRLAVGLGLITAVTRRARQAADTESPGDLIEAGAQLGMPVSGVALRMADVSTAIAWGWRRPVLLLPASWQKWPPLQRRSVLLHELAHVQRRDWLVSLAGQVACALHWFNPLAWWLARRMKLEQELACDDKVLQTGIEPPYYAGLLLSSVRDLRSNLLLGCAMAQGGGTLRERMRHLLDRSRNRQGVPGLFRLGAPLAAMLITLLGLMSPVAADDQIYKIADGVVAPVIVEKVEPSYTPEAKDAKIEGSVVLSFVIRPDGTPSDITLARGLDAGLDRNAVEAVQQWRFKPATKDGKPVAVAVRAEVNFRLL